MRIEKDALGEVQVPADAYFGAQTQRAISNFDVGRELFPVEMIQAHALVKKAAAIVNRDTGLLKDDLAKAVIQAADEVIEGQHDNQFPLSIWQSGSGTQFNMNMNEVIANRAIEILGGTIGTKKPVHPNDHVNMSQSTNDTIPTSIHIAAVVAIKYNLLKEIDLLYATLINRAQKFRDIVKIGRTHLQDATPLTLGQEFSGYADQIQQAGEGIHSSLDHLYELAIGGTAVGTGLNTREDYPRLMVETINEITNLSFRPARNTFAALAAHDAVVRSSGTLKTLAAALMKIANDIRWLASGPRCGIGELILPSNEPGSSIMPGKVNPTQCEMVTQVCCMVFGNDTAIAMAGSQGNFELNVYKPLLAYTFIQSINLLSDAMRSFRENGIMGLKADKDRIAEHLNNSLMLVTALNRHIGYDRAAEIALKAWRDNLTLKDAAMQLGYLSEQDFDEFVRPEKMTGPDQM